MKPEPATEKSQKNIWLFNIGVLSGLFGLVYMMVPLYKTFCQKMGLQGDNHKKDYSQMSKNKKSNKNRKFKVTFEGEADPEMNWDFEPEQHELKVHSGETALMFYRALNKQSKPMIGTAIYTVYPEFASQYFSKIQCFCFNQQMLNPGEEVLMPLYFYFEPEIEEDPNLQKIDNIIISYRFFRCKKQDLAKLVQEQNKKELTDKLKLLESRRTKFPNTDPQFEYLSKQIANIHTDLDNMAPILEA
jgi:cytochrome c oxidase assembly protein subunit 11